MHMEGIQLYAFTLGKALVIQVIGVLGIFFVFGFILSRIQHWTQTIYMRSTGWKGILWTAWIGTPVHELGHAFFCKVFRHRIEGMYLFQPNQKTGGLGHVDHSYDQKSLYQRIGNFFIGGAPMIWGAIVLFILVYFVAPNGKDIFAPLMSEFTGVFALFGNIWESLSNLFSLDNLSSWQFWVFLYVSFAVSSHLAPSPADQKGMWKGFFWLVFILLIVNAIAFLFGVDITSYVLKINQYLGIFTAIFTYALIISIIHLLFAFILLSPFRKRNA